MTQIAKDFGVHYESLQNHNEKHISPKIANLLAKKEVKHDMQLLAKIDGIYEVLDEIVERNHREKRDLLTIKAISEQSRVIDMVAKISYEYHSIELLRLERAKLERQDKTGETQTFISESLQYLTTSEVRMFNKLLNKIYNRGSAVIIPDKPSEFKNVTGNKENGKNRYSRND